MNDFLIFADGSADLDLEFAKENKINFIPMQYTLGDDEALASGTNTDEEMTSFYEALAEGKFSKTSQVTPFQYEEALSPYLEAGHSILLICLSSGLSGTYESACIAAKTLKEKYPTVDLIPVDSLNATGAAGILLHKASQYKNDGLDIYQIQVKLNELVKKLHTIAYVESLTHLKRGGRISSTSAVIGSMLNIKPMIKVLPNGKLENYDKKMGSKRAMIHMADVYKELADMNERVVYITECNNKEFAEGLAAKFKTINPNVDVKIKKMSVIIGTHTGPGSIALSFLKK